MSNKSKRLHKRMAKILNRLDEQDAINKTYHKII